MHVDECPIAVYGCTDASADNFDPNATVDDGSCEYTVLGCTDSTANNYNELATEDDGSCQYMETVPCNGMVILCHRTYDQVTFPETHNSYSTHEDNIFIQQAIIALDFKRSGMLECVRSCWTHTI